MDRIVILAGYQRPHEVVLQTLALVVGVAYVIGAPPPTSVAALMPEWAVRTWAAGLLVSGLLSAAALVWRGLEVSLRLEQAAMLAGAASLVWAGYAVFAYAPTSRALLAGGLCVAWSAANAIRAWQCQRDVSRIVP